jgi:hypothetical protein
MARKRRVRQFALKPEASPGECRVVENGAGCGRAPRNRGLCMLHYNLLLNSGELDRFALPSRARSGGVGSGGPRHVSRNPAPLLGQCLVIDRGAPCTRQADSRGVCATHAVHLRRVRLIDEIALPPTKRVARAKLAVGRDKKAPEGRCSIVVAGRSCLAARYGSTYALCEKHQKYLWGRAGGALEDFRIPEVGVRYSRKKTVEPSLCAVREWSEARGYEPCQRAPEKRGVCAHHMWVLRHQVRTFEEVANPRRTRHVELRREARKPGACVAVENGVGCPKRAWRTYGVCARHYQYLKRHGRAAELESRHVPLLPAVRARRPEAERRPGLCLLSIDGVPCDRPVLQRGLCKACYTALWRTPLLDELALAPARKKERVLGRASAIVSGVCVATEDGVLCEHGSKIRGLCPRHYRLAQEFGQLHLLAVSEEELEALPRVPALYLAGDVLLRFADHEVFGSTTERSAVKLVSAVLSRTIRATVSFEAARALYSHLGHRLARPASEGGRALSEPLADKEARRYVGELLFGRSGLWHVVPYSEDDLRLLTHRGRLPKVTLEEGLEVHCYARAKSMDRSSLFVTSGTDVLSYGEGVHPRRVVDQLGLGSK